MSSEAFIVDAVRTPLGRIGGALAGVRPDDLLAGVVRAVVERSPSTHVRSARPICSASWSEPMKGHDHEQ